MSRIDKAIELASKKKQGNEGPSGGKERVCPVEDAHEISAAGYDRIAPLSVENPYLVPMTDPNGHAAEQYKKLRSMIIRKTCLEPDKNSFLVTSAIAGEGKSMTAMNLAITLAKKTDNAVVLIDTDLRNPQLHQMLGLEPELGLVHYLRDDVRLENVMHKIGLGNLSLIPAGERLEDPLELLTSTRMRRLVVELKERYPDRYVLLDTPPVLPFADLRTLGELVDHVVFVCREGYTSLDQIEGGLEVMSEFSLLGIVCNDMGLAMKSDYPNYYGVK